MHRYWKARHSCPRCNFNWSSEIPPTVMNLRKVDFFWINRDQRSFEWFVNLLSQLEIEQAELGGAMERFLDMHMYITSALQKSDMKAVGLQLALDLLHQKVTIRIQTFNKSSVILNNSRKKCKHTDISKETQLENCLYRYLCVYVDLQFYFIQFKNQLQF